ncbi:glycosyltransferase [Polyangium spumosum]|uniref:Glycosyltransferase n=1 Tax=Polyangium spumosum TaxID=889282 RepID=A0A6N7Q270_9BACT|nr:glycosyltransferase [Polyangium spumosum]MRG97296.1 glycosyltransferase [Polyangium spumosum]
MTEQALSMDESPIELSVIVPCFNEELNLRELATRVLGVFEVGGLVGELVLVDDGSKDGTAAVIRELSAGSAGRIVGCFHPENRGIAAAWRTGVGASRGKLVATIDADLQYQPEDLLRLRRALYEYSVDVVQGFRSAVGRRKDQRYHLSRGLNHLLNGVFGMNLSDNKSGFVMCAREVMLDLLTYRGTYFYWQSFIMVAAHAKGYSYKEIETIFEQRRQGTSFLEKTAVRASVLSLVDIGKATWEYRVSRPPPDVAHQFLRRHPVADRTPSRTPVQEARWRAYLAAFDSTHWMITRDVEHHYETLCKTQWLGASETRELQDEKLRRLIRHAYRNVPYYRARMQERGLRPEDIRGQADLHKLPLLTKADIRKHLYFDIMSENHDKSQVLRIATSGSTGEPFVCYADRVQLELRWAATLRAQEWTGYRFGDPCVRLWHQTIGMSKSQIRKERADAMLSNRTFVPVFEMSEKNLAAMVRTIAQAEPVLLDGYAEALDFLARYLQAHGDLSVRPRAVMSSAQTLPIPSRRVIEQAFGCAVFDKYGSREFSGIAYECEAHAGHHVVAEGYIVEILKGGEPAKPGEIGEVVITDLTNMCMPFIRYRIGDLAEAMDAWAPCTCGRGAPRIGAIEGRVQSIIQGTDGQHVPGTFFAHYLKEYDHAIKQFQVVQEELGAITFRVVKGGRFSDDVLGEVLAKFREVLGHDLRITVDFVDEVAMVRTGKRVAAVSRLGIDFQRSSASVVPSVDRGASRA